MTVFAYRARGQNGQMIRAEMDATSEAAVASRLLEVGATPLNITAILESTDPLEKFVKRWRPAKVKTEDLIVFSRQMFRLVKSGIPIANAIVGLAETTKQPALATALRDVSDGLRSGRELSSALAMHRNIFPDIVINVVRVGEETGHLEAAFDRVSSYLELEVQTRRRIKSATRYPMMVLAAIVMAMLVINAFVVPAFAQVFEGFGAELPWATRTLIASSDFLIAYWYLLLGLAMASVIGVRMWLDTPDGRLTWDRWKLSIPAVGNILERATIARYARAFEMTFSAGVPVIQTMQTVALAVENSYVTKKVREMSGNIERGETFSKAAASCGLFDPIALQMLSVGEESGELAEMHREIAETYEAEVDYDLRRLSDLIEPMLIVAIGGIVLVLALGVYLPMWDFSSAIKGGG
ncbi:MAG: type II secretion system F family protein [bacterium]|nr:type II secretion system F family protein [bacterium]